MEPTFFDTNVLVYATLDQDVVKKSLTPRFLECFNEGCKDPELKAYVDSLL